VRGGDRSALGLWGEQQAAQRLEQDGYRILARRFRCREGEIDLVAAKGAFLCFVEVKLRKNDRMGQAREFVTRSKQEKLRTAALRYLMEHPSGRQPRFDVVEVYAPQGEQTRRPVIRHWENAF
jgi:putative endonuclease